MKTVILALLVLVILSQGEALRCYCGGPWDPPCRWPIKTCDGLNPVCVQITNPYTTYDTYLRGCMQKHDCEEARDSNRYVYCCRESLCNLSPIIQDW